MRGFDRPLRPEWIYHTIQLLAIGDDFHARKNEINQHLQGLTGENGKRKVLTVIARYYLRDINNPFSGRVQDNLIFHLIKRSSFEEAKPLMLFNLLVKAPVLQYFSQQIYRHYGYGKERLLLSFLQEKAFQRMGERDIAARSLRNFLYTLQNFDILFSPSYRIFEWKKRLEINEEMVIDFFHLYGRYYLNSPQVSLMDLPEHIFSFFIMPDLLRIAHRYNGRDWQYVRRTNASFIILKKRNEK